MAFNPGDLITSAWLNRRHNQTLRPEDFGADGTDGGNDTLALQTMIDAVGVNGVVELSSKAVYCVTSISLKAGMKLIGNGATINFISGGQSYCISMASYSAIENCIFTFGANLSSKSCVLQLSNVSHCQIANNQFLAPQLTGGATSQSVDFLSQLDAIIKATGVANIKVNNNVFKRLNKPCISAQCLLSEFNFNQFDNINVAVGSVIKGQCINLTSSSEYQVLGNKFYNTSQLPCVNVNGGAGTISNNVANNVYTFLKVEQSNNVSYEAVIFSNNAIRGFADITLDTKAVWLNCDSTSKNFQATGNVIVGFRVAFYSSAADMVSVVGNSITSCGDALNFNMIRNFTCVANTFNACTNGIQQDILLMREALNIVKFQIVIFLEMKLSPLSWA